MRTARFLLPLLLAAAPALACPEHGAAPLNLTGKYAIRWNGITLGRIYLRASETKTRYTLEVDTKTHGIASVFARERRVALTEGRFDTHGNYLPRRYESRPQDDDKGRVTTLAYNAKGEIEKRTRVPDDDPDWRAPVPVSDLKNVTDPITAGLLLRRNMRAAITKGENEITLPTYDGARLARFHFTLSKLPARVEVMDSYRDATTLVITREPIAGYTPKELKKFNAGDPLVKLYFSDDAAMIPLRATAETAFGEVSATLEQVE